jgi:cation-transporting ATPase 13A2
MTEAHSPEDSFFNDLAKDGGLEDAEEFDGSEVEERRRPGRRRDSQVGSSYGDNDLEPSTAIFDGPASYNYPNSISSMYRERQIQTGRTGTRAGSRRVSRDLTGEQGAESLLLGRRLSSGSQVFSDEDDGLHVPQYPANFDSQRSASPTWGTASVFGGIASFFGRGGPAEETVDGRPLSRRSSRMGSRSSLLTRRSSEHSYRSGASRERWGYTSGEDDFPPSPSASNLGEQESISEPYSRPPSRDGGFPLLSRDPLFGDLHQQSGVPDEAVVSNTHSGPPSRQQIFLSDEDATVQFVGYEIVPWKYWSWNLGCYLSVGSLALIGNWFPRLWLNCTMREQPFEDIRKGYIVVEVN